MKAEGATLKKSYSRQKVKAKRARRFYEYRKAGGSIGASPAEKLGGRSWRFMSAERSCFPYGDDYIKVTEDGQSGRFLFLRIRRFTRVFIYSVGYKLAGAFLTGYTYSCTPRKKFRIRCHILPLQSHSIVEGEIIRGKTFPLSQKCILYSRRGINFIKASIFYR